MTASMLFFISKGDSIIAAFINKKLGYVKDYEEDRRRLKVVICMDKVL